MITGLSRHSIDMGMHYIKNLSSACTCSPGLRENGWQAERDPYCSQPHSWLLTAPVGFYPWSPLE